MNRDYAIESLNYSIEQSKKWDAEKFDRYESERKWLENFVTEPEILELCLSLDEKTVSIAKKLQESLTLKHVKVTSKQRYSLANALMFKFKDALNIIDIATKHVYVDEEVKIACGVLVDMGYTSNKNLPDITYRTSKSLAEEIKMKCFYESNSCVINDRTNLSKINFLGISQNGEIIAVTEYEFRKLGFKEIGFNRAESKLFSLSLSN